MATLCISALHDAMTASERANVLVPVLAIGEPSQQVAMASAVTAIGAILLAEGGFDAFPSEIELPARRMIIAIETRDAKLDQLAAALPSLAATAQSRDMPVVIGVSAQTIDIVAASFIGTAAQLICDPSEADRRIALSIASHLVDDSAPSDKTTFEGDAARLKRLNDEVERISGVLSRLTKKDSEAYRFPLGDAASAGVFATAPSDNVTIEPSEIRRAIRARRLRDQHFGGGLFEEPGWDMILDLFAAELERVRVSVSSLCIAAAVAPTTALRWISKFVEAGIFERQPDPFDRRRAYMELSDRASVAMREYIKALRRAGLSLA